MKPNQPAEAEGLVLGSGGGQSMAFGTVAQRLLANGFNINALRTNDVLRRLEWQMFDETVVQVARAALVGVGDLITSNLRMPIPNAMGITIVQHESISDMSDASIDMSGLTEAENDRVDFTPHNVPLPIVHKDFHLSLRNLESGRRLGTPVDTSMAATAARRVADAAEDMLFNGVSITAGGGTVYGYTNFPSINTGSITANWATASGAQIIADVLAMIEALQGDNMYGPYMIYVPVNAYTNMQNDYNATYPSKTILERVLAIPGIRGVKATTRVAAGKALMVQWTKDVIDWLDGMQPTTLQWEAKGGLLVHFKVMMIGAPRPKADSSGQCGIVLLS
jgi:uncharacterized linocin/CFP29 family protein